MSRPADPPPLEGFRRYAVYALPEPGPLAAFGAGWLGWDIAAGRSVARPKIPGLPPFEVDPTARCRRYGFHATIKPPFALTGTAEALQAELAHLAENLGPVPAIPLELACLGRFVALVPTAPQPALQALAAEVVRGLDPHRAPMTEAEAARRTHPGLTLAQRDNLARWGYPHVMETFRFHLTLSDRLPARAAARLREALAPELAPLISSGFALRSLVLCGEDEDGMFHLLRRVPLRG
ncbi:DUF1045 domain-containing protein [Poseidonocella sedimentorum]|uniref:Phosphonate metabolism protein n=1 Tax=Poseidonocella sedimentorum TaxID=871652 RepID=A0A1I6D4A8_9RHOB|nr:DUF1045 domain-containing protein [Poseidonocella sedimentorum]SFR00152.1 Protein of unknown function [Poseidonocella sedimentorum]